GDLLKKYSKREPENENDPQPVLFSMDNMSWRFCNTANLSVCILKLKFINHGSLVLEDFKIYLEFENVLSVASVNKRKNLLDSGKYKYNIQFKKNLSAEFIPEQTVLVQEDAIELDPICFKTTNLPCQPV